MKRRPLVILISVSIGVTITLLTSVFPDPFSRPLVGESLLGAPLPWISEFTGNPTLKVVRWVELITDVTFWTGISCVVCFLVLGDTGPSS